MRIIYCHKCCEYKRAYEGRVECMDCTKARSSKNHFKNHAHRLQYLKDYYLRNKANA